MDRTESENLKAEQQKLPNLNNKQNEIIEGAGGRQNLRNL